MQLNWLASFSCASGLSCHDGLSLTSPCGHAAHKSCCIVRSSSEIILFIYKSAFS